MIEIAIDDEIGIWGITASYVSDKLVGIANGEDIKIIINSPGGSISHGIAIFNIIREYAKTHPVSVIINGIAASMATYIALAARTVNSDARVEVTDNSIFVIHNPWEYASGDYRTFQKRADWLQRLAFMFASTYAAVSGQAKKAVQSAMDAETYYLGNEICQVGYATHYEKLSENPQDKNELTVNAKMRIDTVKKNMIESGEPEDYEKTAALLQNTYMGSEGQGAGSRNHNESEAAGALPPIPGTNITQKPDGGETPAGKGGSMDKEELKAKFPEVYAAIYAEGREAGIKDERERTAAHLKLGERAGSLETAAKYIRDGASVMSEEVQSEYLSLNINKKAVDSRNADDPAVIHAGGSGVEDDAKALAAFETGYTGRKAGGERG
jgi:ATP-dependent protease ClpP protease subunit